MATFGKNNWDIVSEKNNQIHQHWFQFKPFLAIYQW